MKKEESMNKALFRLNAKAESEKVYDFLIQFFVDYECTQNGHMQNIDFIGLVVWIISV